MKKFIALVLAVAMMMTVANVFAAADLTADSTITIKGLTAGDVVTLYKVIDWVGTENSVAGWTFAQGYSTIYSSEDLAKIIDPLSAGYTGLTSDIAGDLSRVEGKKQVGDPITVTGTEVTFNVAAKDIGMYMAIISPKDVNTVYNPVFVSADWSQESTSPNEWTIVTSEDSYNQYNNATGAAKKSVITLDKASEATGDDHNDDNGKTVAVGDELKFTVTTTIPGYGETFDDPMFELTDTMDLLKYDTTKSLTVTATGLTPNDYVISNESENGYTLTIKKEFLRKLETPLDLKVEYYATVKAATDTANIEEELNTVNLTYSHDPSTVTTGKQHGDLEYKKDKTTHFTFSIDADNLWSGSEKVGESGTEIVKISVDRNGNPIMSETKVYSNVTETEYEASPLAGCTFELYKADDSWVKGAKVATVNSDANGRIKFEGLDAGKYILIETAAPSGYIRDTSEHRIDITAVINQVSVTEYYDQDGKWYTAAGEGRKAYTYSFDDLKSYQITFDGATVASHTFMHTSENNQIKWSNTDRKSVV